MKKYKTQVKKNHYFKKRYLTVNRWSTYSKIIKWVLQIRPTKILEIGPGNRLVSDILRKLGFNIKILDFDISSEPDYYMDIREENILELKNKFDLIIACQVFEHIQYDDFLNVLRNLSMITKMMIISLPYTNENAHYFSFNINFLLFNLESTFKYFFRRIHHPLNSHHYWEIGEKKYPLRKIKKGIRNNGWNIKKNFINTDNPYHYFFILSTENNP